MPKIENDNLPSDKQLYSKTLEKGLRVLSLFHEGHQGFTLTEISRMLGINKTSISRILNTYVKMGYLRKDPRSKLIKLGPQTIALAHSFMHGSDLLDLVKPVVDRAYTHFHVSIDVALLHGDSMYLVYRRENQDTLNFNRLATGKGLHFLATGKAALAHLPAEQQSKLIDRLELDKKTDRTIVTKAQLIKDLKQTLARGYAINNEEYLPGLLAIGAPLMNRHTPQVQGAMSVMTSTQQYKRGEFERKFAEAFVELSKEISTLLPPS